jgi:hypothetical protein
VWKGEKKICWVKWDTVCQSKRNAGLGVKDIRVMNVSILAKWRWRLLDGEVALWKEVLGAKYGASVGGLLLGAHSGRLRCPSLWWKEISKLGDFGEFNWFNSGLERKVGNELNTSFWCETWRGDRSFRNKYPTLYSISAQKEAMVGEVGLVTEFGTEWIFSWRRHLFKWEEEVLLSLKEDLVGARLTNEVDMWRWRWEDSGVFSVNSAYRRLKGIVFNEVPWREDEKGVFENLWKCPVPSKVVAFAWRAILNRVPTKANLALRNVLGPEVNSLCGLCNTREESVHHLFLHCEVASEAWLSLMRWLNHYFISPPNLVVHWECWLGGDRANKVKKGLGIIWLATIWALWKSRNDKVFNEANVEVDAIVEEVKVLAWKWAMGRMSIPVCLFFEWCWNPKWCLNRSPIRW